MKMANTKYEKNRLYELRAEMKRTKKERKDWTKRFISNELDVSERTYTNYENGTVSIPSSALIKLADLFDCSIDYILCRSEIHKVFKNSDTKKLIPLFEELTGKDEVFKRLSNIKKGDITITDFFKDIKTLAENSKQLNEQAKECLTKINQCMPIFDEMLKLKEELEAITKKALE
jgi:transcriptional regulator with XRE-family HTH domain